MLLASAPISGKEEQHTFHIRDPLEVIRAEIRLDRRNQVFTMPRLRNLDNFVAMHGTGESRAYTMEN